MYSRGKEAQQSKHTFLSLYVRPVPTYCYEYFVPLQREDRLKGARPRVEMEYWVLKMMTLVLLSRFSLVVSLPRGAEASHSKRPFGV